VVKFSESVDDTYSKSRSSLPDFVGTPAARTATFLWRSFPVDALASLPRAICLVQKHHTANAQDRTVRDVIADTRGVREFAEDHILENVATAASGTAP